MLALNDEKAAVLVMLDFSVAFDTVDHIQYYCKACLLHGCAGPGTGLVPVLSGE